MKEAFNQMKDKKATGDDGDVPAEVLQLLGEEGHKLMTQLTLHSVWTKNDTMEVTTIALNQKPEATKCHDHCIISLNAHAEKIRVKIFRRTEKKIEGVLGEHQFTFRRGRRTRNAVGMLRILSQRTSTTDDELCA